MAVQFAKLDRGTMGMLFDGPHLWAVANRALLRYDDVDGDGRADGPPQQFLRLANGEHGAHAIRKGPDGWLYLVGGNDTGFTPGQFNSPQSPLKKTEGGAIIRFSPDGKTFEALSCGFRNPYDFDFNWRGDLFTYDSDTERTFYLPWYMPTRLYHAAIGGHHGWRTPGYKRSWARPGYYADTVPMLDKIGRGSPTGVAVYSHRLIPKEMQDGVFLLDWTFGNVWFYPLRPANASYQAPPQLFISPVGTDGFAPSDIEVGRNGEIYISIGGRGTKGSVFRVVPTPENRNHPNNRPPAMDTPLDKVLNAPQPLAEWSRARWQPLARQIGAGHFVEAALVQQIHDQLQFVQAFEIGGFRLITGLHQGVETMHDQLRGAAAQHGLFAEQVCFGFLRKGGVQYAGVGAAQRVRVAQRLVRGLTRCILVNRAQARYAPTLLELPAYQVARRLGRHHDHVAVGRRLDRAKVNIESVGKQQRVARLEHILDLFEHGGLRHVGHQHGDQLGRLRGFPEIQYVKSVRRCGLCRGPTRAGADQHVVAGIPQVVGMRTALAAVAQHGQGLPLERVTLYIAGGMKFHRSDSSIFCKPLLLSCAAPPLSSPYGCPATCF